MDQTEPRHTSTFLDGKYIGMELGNSVEREAAVKAELIATYGPVRLMERVVGGRGRVVMNYRTVPSDRM